jgi:tetratricopeptide (TPR) repeat protein
MRRTSTAHTQELRASSVARIRWLLVWCGFLLCLGWLLGVAPTQAAETAEIAYDKGVLAYSNREYIEALDYLEQAAALEPDNPDVQFYLGLTLTRLGEFDKAIAALEKSQRLDASKQYVHYHLGLAYFHAGRYTEALPQFEAASQFDAQKAPTFFYLGQTLYELKRYNEAIPHFERAMQLDPSLTPSVQYYRGLALYATERDVQAQEAFEAVLQAGPDAPLARQSQRYLEALAQRASARRLVQLQGTVSFEYDDNVIVEPNDVPLGKHADGRVVFNVIGRLLPVRTPLLNLGIEYAFFQSLHFDLHDFDVQSHTGGLFATYKLEGVTLYAAANYNYTLLDDTKFSEAVTLQPSAVITESDTLFTVASVRYRLSNYFDDVPPGEENDVRERDGWAVRAGFYQYLLFNKQRSSLRASYHYEGSRNEGTDWEYNSHEFGVALQTAFWWDMTLTVEGTYTHFGYLHINSFAADPLGDLTPADTQTRKDNRFIGVVALTRPLGRFLTLTASYVHTSNLSNLDFFDYHRNIWSLALTGRY